MMRPWTEETCISLSPIPSEQHYDLIPSVSPVGFGASVSGFVSS